VSDERRRMLDSPLVLRAARGGIVAWSLIGIVVLFAVFFRFVVYPVRIIFPPLVLAMIVVYLLNPLVTRMERRGIGRVWGTLITYVVALAIIGTLLTFMVPIFVDQVKSFVRHGPTVVNQVTDWLREIGGRLGFNIQDVAPEAGGVFDVLGRLVSIGQRVAEVIFVFVVGPILAFYLLVDLPKIKRGMKALIPSRRRREVEAVTEKVGRAVGGFFRGQLLVAMFVGFASGLALWIVGLPFWAVVGLVAGIFNLIPLIGPFIGGFVAVIIAFTTDVGGGGLLNLEPGLPLAVGSAIALLIVQQIDNHIISPNIVARTVNLHPVTVMLGLLAGGTLLGLWGMLLAVPVLASIKVLLLHAWDTRMQWPPRDPDGVRPPPRDVTMAEQHVEQAQTAGGHARPSESRGSWWHTFRAVLSPGKKPRPGEPAPPEDGAREPEPTSGSR
jgi:predicted PurR-regulated permease PerM